MVTRRAGSTASPDGQTQGQQLAETATVTRSIVDAVVVKEGDLFLFTEPGGQVPFAGPHGLGLYYHDCRYLNGYELRIAGARPDVLTSSTAQGYLAVSQLALPDHMLAKGQFLAAEDLAVKRERIVASDQLVVYDLITFHNYGLESISLPVSLSFRSAFEDLFAVRGMTVQRRGTLWPPAWHERVLSLRYDGVDECTRTLEVRFSWSPTAVEEGAAHFRVRLAPRATRRLLVSLTVGESAGPVPARVADLSPARPADVRRVLKHASDVWLAGETEVESSSLALNAIMDRSIRDLRVLRSRIGNQEFFAAGVPWFCTLFGRDSLITAIQMLAYNPRIAAQTLRILATHQGEREDPWRDEQPGKILHELRVGEMARSGQIPHSPYFGTIDATPLFLALVAFHANWTGDLALFNELRPNVERALEWLKRYGDADGDGYLEYACRSDGGLANQGWRDSAEGVPNADGSLAAPPIALCEVQGYLYAAKRGIAGLFRRSGEEGRAVELDREADELSRRFNQDFWLEDLGTYALALQAAKRPVAVVTSNAGQVLWSAIADRDKAVRTADRLMAPDMFSGWGVRTLSEREVRFNPTGYHLGTVWPHDNALIAAGFRRYGLDDYALRIFRGIVEAAMYSPDYRLPELFMGFPRSEYGVPVSYPVACRPQAWAAGAVPYLVRTLLGLTADAFEHRLRIIRPVLPDFVHHLEVRRLRVGEGSVDLRFERTANGKAAVEVLRLDGRLDVVVDLGALPT